MAESIQSYTAARVDYLARYLQTLLPGLDYKVATTWINAEKGVSGNVLGTTYTDASGQRLFTYPSQEAGLRAAADWINTRSIYSGVKASLSGTSSEQASALASSPWNRSYYPGVFKGLISPTGSSVPSGGASTPQTPSPSATPDYTALADSVNLWGMTPTGEEKPLIDLMTPIIFLGVILVGITLIATGGLITLKGKAA